MVPFRAVPVRKTEADPSLGDGVIAPGEVLTPGCLLAAASGGAGPSKLRVSARLCVWARADRVSSCGMKQGSGGRGHGSVCLRAAI